VLSVISNGVAGIDFIFIAKGKDDVQIPAGTITAQDARTLVGSYLTYFKVGHDNYFYFYPAIGQKDMLMISEDYNTFWDFYSDAKEDEIFSVSLSNLVNFVILHTVNGYGAFM
jgi:hypothetical protein